MVYYRVHTADIAYLTKQPRGIFTAIGKLVDAKILSDEEEKEYWKNREYFEKELPGQIIYEDDYQIAVINQKEDLETKVTMVC